MFHRHPYGAPHHVPETGGVGVGVGVGVGWGLLKTYQVRNACDTQVLLNPPRSSSSLLAPPRSTFHVCSSHVCSSLLFSRLSKCLFHSLLFDGPQALPADAQVKVNCPQPRSGGREPCTARNENLHKCPSNDAGAEDTGERQPHVRTRVYAIATGVRGGRPRRGDLRKRRGRRRGRGSIST